MKGFHSEEMEKLYKAILTLKNTEECSKFFEDICTVKELKDIAQRLEVAKMLKEGKSYQTFVNFQNFLVNGWLKGAQQPVVPHFSCIYAAAAV